MCDGRGMLVTIHAQCILSLADDRHAAFANWLGMMHNELKLTRILSKRRVYSMMIITLEDARDLVRTFPRFGEVTLPRVILLPCLEKAMIEDVPSAEEFFA